MSLVVDTSALIAIANAEPEGPAFLDAIAASSECFASTATLFEAHSVARRWEGGLDPERLELLLTKLELAVVPFDVEQLEAAKVAYTRYVRGSKHRAGLNMGDCFAYALAKTRNLPLLFKGEDFLHTDIRPALSPA